MQNTVLATLDRTLLSSALTQFHRRGYGHVIKVIDPQRAPVGDQLRRAGVPDTAIAGRVTADQVLLFVPSPARTGDAAIVAHGAGAADIEIVEAGEPLSWSLPSTLQREATQRHARRRPTAAPLPVATPDLPETAD